MAQNYKVESPAPVRRVVPPSVLARSTIFLTFTLTHTQFLSLSLFLSLHLHLDCFPFSSHSALSLISQSRQSNPFARIILIASVVIIPTKSQQTLIPAYCSLNPCKLALISQSSAHFPLPPLSFARIELGQQRIWDFIQFPIPVKYLRALYRHPEAGTVDCPCVPPSTLPDPHTYTTTSIAVVVLQYRDSELSKDLPVAVANITLGVNLSQHVQRASWDRAATRQ